MSSFTGPVDDDEERYTNDNSPLDDGPRRRPMAILHIDQQFSDDGDDDDDGSADWDSDVYDDIPLVAKGSVAKARSQKGIVGVIGVVGVALVIGTLVSMVVLEAAGGLTGALIRPSIQAKLAGKEKPLMKATKQGPKTPLPVSTLFETASSPDVLATSCAVYRKSGVIRVKIHWEPMNGRHPTKKPFSSINGLSFSIHNKAVDAAAWVLEQCLVAKDEDAQSCDNKEKSKGIFLQAVEELKDLSRLTKSPSTTQRLLMI
jgi:hypothetical protein